MFLVKKPPKVAIEPRGPRFCKGSDFAVICVTIVSLLVPPLFWDSVTGLG
jgi:hypothetical protein